MRIRNRGWWNGVFICLLLLCACAPKTDFVHVPSPVFPTATFLVKTTPPKPASASTLSTSLTGTPAVLPTEGINPQLLKVCSPIEGMSLQSLNESVVTPFLPPPPGSDIPHHGVDLADIGPATHLALEGRGVNAVISGKVAGLVFDRFPYGNAVIVETSLEEVPAKWINDLEMPVIRPVDLSTSSLTCPVITPLTSAGESEEVSLYILYAHLLERPSLRLGESVECGQKLGKIGNTGNSINPHLHLEVRIGIENVQFGSMAHYDAGATTEEMSTYCLWRISGYFQFLNPMRLLEFLNPG